MYSSYPVFESGQTLTSGHLNHLLDYLEPQDRLTRSKLIGIGVVCGLRVLLEDDAIRLTAGCAVTSAGYLLVETGVVLTQFHEYHLPVPGAEEEAHDLVSAEPYSFFHDSDGEQIALWELLPADYSPGPAEPTPTQLDAGFLSDKVVLLFLETNLEALRNCDISDCSDKGAEMEFTVRRLLVSEEDARAILQQEQQLAAHPVDRHEHPRYALVELQVEKLGLAAHTVDDLGKLFDRVMAIAVNLHSGLLNGLQKSFEAYKYLLEEMYPVAEYPDGPFGDPTFFSRVMDELHQNPLMLQYCYGFLHDIVLSYNEFLRKAQQLDAECCPDERRFPQHVLLGQATELPVADLTATTGLGPAIRPTPLRHHFIPSPLYECCDERLERIRALHYRTFLLAHRYRSFALIKADIRITPSRDGDYALSDVAIPFYYSLNDVREADDLVRNWSPQLTSSNRLDQVFSYWYMNPDPKSHVLRFRMDDHNFYRVEGMVGKPFGTVLQQLQTLRQQLSLSFAVLPVGLSPTLQKDAASAELNKKSQALAQAALAKMLDCRMRELDLGFRMITATMFYYLYSVVRLLAHTNTVTVAGMSPFQEDDPRPTTGRPGSKIKIDRSEAEMVLKDVRGAVYTKGEVTRRTTIGDDPKTSIGRLYEKVKDGQAAGNLFDRTTEFAKELDATDNSRVVAQKLYSVVSLIDKAEELIALVKAPSVAEFHFDKFQSKYDGFVQAFEAFLEASTVDKLNARIPRTYAALQATYNAIAAMGPQTIFGNLLVELRTQLATEYQQLTLPEFARRHPGLEHKGGVREGGTLVLAYAQRDVLIHILRQNQALLSTKMKTAYARFAPGRTPPAMEDAVFAAIAEPGSRMNEFIVLADFCLPYLCCDFLCSDEQIQIRQA